MGTDYKDRKKSLDSKGECGVCGTDYLMVLGFSNSWEDAPSRDTTELQLCTACGYNPLHEEEIYSIISKNLKVTFTEDKMSSNKDELAKLVTQEAWKLFTKKE